MNYCFLRFYVFPYGWSQFFTFSRSSFNGRGLVLVNMAVLARRRIAGKGRSLIRAGHRDSPHSLVSHSLFGRESYMRGRPLVFL